MIVVFPTPGPPVIMLTLFSRDVRTARSCAGARRKPLFPSHQDIALSESIASKDLADDINASIFRATRRSAQYRSARYTRLIPPSASLSASSAVRPSRSTITRPSASSILRASESFSTGISTSSFACSRSSGSGVQQCPKSSASV